MKSDVSKAFAASMIGASLFFGQAARAEIDYDGIKYLGGGDKIDLNNANVRAYLKVSNLTASCRRCAPFLFSSILLVPLIHHPSSSSSWTFLSSDLNNQ